jgi:lipopolysaccharide biosynthesis regulator YciM
MKSVSKAALAVALLMGAPAFIAGSPAVAQKKGANSPQVSEAFRKPAGEVQKLVEAKDWAGVKARIDALDAVAQSDDEKYYAASFRLAAAAGTSDNPNIIRALDALIVNPKTPQADLGRYNFFRGDLAYQQKQYPQAANYLLKARELGYQPQGTNLNLKIAQAQLDGGQVAQGAASIDAAIKAEEAAGRKAPEAWYKVVVSKFYTGGDKANAAAWLARQAAAYPSPETWRSSLMVYMEQASAKGATLDADLRLDVLRLIRAAKGLAGTSDYYEYADAAQRRGLPWEVVSLVDEGRAAGKISRPNPQIDPLYTQAVNRQKAEVSLTAEEKRAASAANGAVAMSTADAYLASGNNAKAVELYRLALQKGGVDTSLVNTRLGIALARSGQKAEAKTAFAAVTTGPRAELARFWSAWVDTQA